LFRSRTGLVLDPYFSGTKVAWLLDESDGLRKRADAGELLFGTIDTWLVYQLSGGVSHVTDVTNASRTLMFDINKGAWDGELCQKLGDIPTLLLPEVRGCSEIVATTRGLGDLPDGIPIAGIAGDQQAALFGQACFDQGMAKCTYGTGAFVLLNTGTKAMTSNHGLLTTIAWRLGDETHYALEGSAFVAGAVVQWLRDAMQFFENSHEIEALAAEVDSSEGVILVPALTGLGAPHWRPEARGLVSGITRGTKKAHIARAALEGIAFLVYDLLCAMQQDTDENINILRVDGGASANNMLMRFQTDLLNVTIHRPAVLDTTALGAAYLAALAVGHFSSVQEISQSWAVEKSFEPTEDRDGIQATIDAWRIAVAKS